jgi:hypothetical protein
MESAPLLDQMRRDSRRTELWDNKLPVTDHLRQFDGFDPLHDLIGPESPFACRAPDVDSFCIEDQYPDVMTVHGLS